MANKIRPIYKVQRGVRSISAEHLFGNLLAAIDVETTGLDPRKHEIYQLCIIPITPALEPYKEKNLRFFNIKIVPRKPENANPRVLTRARMNDLLLHGTDSDTAEARLREWFSRLPLIPGKKIIPLGHNFGNHDKLFLTEWLGGPLCYDEFFRHDYRDTRLLALGLNDMADWHNEPIPFPSNKLQDICRALQFIHERPHDPVIDCLMTIKAYQRMMRYRDWVAPDMQLREKMEKQVDVIRNPLDELGPAPMTDSNRPKDIQNPEPEVDERFEEEKEPEHFEGSDFE